MSSDPTVPQPNDSTSTPGNGFTVSHHGAAHSTLYMLRSDLHDQGNDQDCAMYNRIASLQRINDRYIRSKAAWSEADKTLVLESFKAINAFIEDEKSHEDDSVRSDARVSSELAQLFLSRNKVDSDAMNRWLDRSGRGYEQKGSAASKWKHGATASQHRVQELESAIREGRGAEVLGEDSDDDSDHVEASINFPIGFIDDNEAGGVAIQQELIPDLETDD